MSKLSNMLKLKLSFNSSNERYSKMKFSIKDFFSECDQIRGFGHIY